MKILIAAVGLLFPAVVEAQNILPDCSTWILVSNPSNMIRTGCSFRSRGSSHQELTLRSPRFTTTRSGWYHLNVNAYYGDSTGSGRFRWKLTDSGEGEVVSPHARNTINVFEHRFVHLTKGKYYEFEITGGATNYGSNVAGSTLTRLQQMPDIQVLTVGHEAGGPFIGFTHVNLRPNTFNFMLVGPSKFASGVNIPGITWPLWLMDPLILVYPKSGQFDFGRKFNVYEIKNLHWQLFEINQHFEMALSRPVNIAYSGS